MPPRYLRVAEALRAQIIDGTLEPGETVPSANRLAHEHDVGRDTALKGLALLRREGLLFLAPDKTIRVGPAAARRTGRLARAEPDEVLDVPPGGVVSARMPTPREREELRLGEGVPVLVVDDDGTQKAYNADRFGAHWPSRPA